MTIMFTVYICFCAVCYWCGEKECGEILLCDCCEKGFCTDCISSYLGHDALQTILSTDPWSCFSCDPSSLLPVTSYLKSTQQIDYFPFDINETRKLLVEVENEFDMWDMKVSEEAEETLDAIRCEMQGASSERSVMYVYIYIYIYIYIADYIADGREVWCMFSIYCWFILR